VLRSYIVTPPVKRKRKSRRVAVCKRNEKMSVLYLVGSVHQSWSVRRELVRSGA